jgi:membrane protease YdiL (CAAX protease family)
MSKRSSIKYPLFWFFLLAMLLGTGVIILVVQGVIPRQLAMTSVLSASIAGLIVTAVDEGTAGLKELLRQLGRWRIGVVAWLIAMFLVLVVILLGSLLNPLFEGEKPSTFRISYDIIPMFLVFFVVSGIGQELGWTGFLTARLQNRFNALTSALVRAVLVWIWHMPLLDLSRSQPAALADFPYGGWIAQEGFLAAAVILLLLFLIPWTILFSWIYNNTHGSVLLVAVLHGSEVWVAYYMLKTGIDPTNLNNYYGYGLLMLLAAVLIVLLAGSKHLSRRFQRPRHQPVRPKKRQVE